MSYGVGLVREDDFLQERQGKIGKAGGVEDTRDIELRPSI
jgi:hypothetical protein